MENMVRRVSSPPRPLAPKLRSAMGMIQLVEKKASRLRGELACCWVLATKMLAWSMSRQAPWSAMSMGIGVVAGSMLVPELPCCWMAWMSVCADMTIGALGDLAVCVSAGMAVWARVV